MVSMHGAWFVSSQPSQPLAIGQVLVDGDSVWASTRSVADQSLAIALYGDGGRLELDCSEPAECGQRHAVFGRASRSGMLRTWLQAAMPWIRHERERFRPHITRGSRLDEAVVVRGAAGLDLAPALHRERAGELQLKLAPLNAAGVSGPSRSLRVMWTPGAPALVYDTVPSGLYSLWEVKDARDTFWILVVDESTGTSGVAAAFAELSRPLQTWTSGAGTEDARMLLRAFLYHLAFDGPVLGPAQ